MKHLTAKHQAQNLNLLVYGLAAIILIPETQWPEFLKTDKTG
tara:strand:+ start:5516 stop:5641 length:126 start_codon:yes stop_codon:yes gene_type:complete